ncbi:calcium and integrin-binding family member 3 isoform 3-T5 [Cyanocitta cristata]
MAERPRPRPLPAALQRRLRAGNRARASSAREGNRACSNWLPDPLLYLNLIVAAFNNNIQTTYKGAFEERTDKSQYSQLKMGNKQTIFTQEQLDAYQDCTFFTRKEILRLFYRYRDLAPQLVPLDYTDKPAVTLPYELIGSMPELKISTMMITYANQI